MITVQRCNLCRGRGSLQDVKCVQQRQLATHTSTYYCGPSEGVNDTWVFCDLPISHREAGSRMLGHSKSQKIANNFLSSPLLDRTLGPLYTAARHLGFSASRLLFWSHVKDFVACDQKRSREAEKPRSREAVYIVALMAHWHPGITTQ
jgi:hypothetical protein